MSGTEPADPAPVDPATDDGWRRLHPATPLLNGGIAIIAIAGILVANLRDRVVYLFLPEGEPGEDPIDIIVDNGLVVVALLVVLAVVLLIIAVGFVSWRMHTYRVTAESVEVRQGVLFRRHRRARLDRIQGIAVQRTLFARLFGAARLRVSVAGEDADIPLAYLGSTVAEELRREILQLASGAQRTAVDGVAAAPGTGESAAPAAATADVAAAGADAAATRGVVGRRLEEFRSPELDPRLAAAESVVRMHPGRLIGSILLSSGWLFVLPVVAVLVLLTVFVSPFVLFGLVPALLGFVPALWNRITGSLRYSIALTPDGVRIGSGLLSTSNNTLPPGRIHSVSISQDLLWRPFDWWTVRVNRAGGRSSSSGQAARQNTTVLPVGDRADVLKVLELLLPSLVTDESRAVLAAGLEKARADDGYTTSPRRAAVLRWFSWRRNGFALGPDAVVLRRGSIWRELVLVPAARLQGVAVRQGPLLRLLRLGAVHLVTVSGPISGRLGALDVRDAEGLFRDSAATAVRAAAADRSHRWGRAEGTA